jgi:hypothetical protein
MSARLNWARAKPARPPESKSCARVYADGDLARRARKAMQAWKRTLSKRDQRRLAAVTP